MGTAADFKLQQIRCCNCNCTKGTPNLERASDTASPRHEGAEGGFSVDWIPAWPALFQMLGEELVSQRVLKFTVWRLVIFFEHISHPPETWNWSNYPMFYSHSLIWWLPHFISCHRLVIRTSIYMSRMFSLLSIACFWATKLTSWPQ